MGGGISRELRQSRWFKIALAVAVGEALLTFAVPFVIARFL